MTKHCRAKIDTVDETLVCAEPPDHDGPTHRDKNGREWGDPDLFMPAPMDEEPGSTD